MMTLKKYKLLPYVAEMWVAISDAPGVDVPKVNKRYPGLNFTWADDFAAWTNDHYYKDYIIGVVFDSSQYSINTAVHEAVHVVNRIFKHSGAKLDIDNDEHIAYWTAHVTDLIIQTYNKHLKK